MLRIIARVTANVLALYLAKTFLPGFIITGGWKILLLASLILAIFNAILKPILKTISFPLILLSLGLFTIAINIIILWLLTYFIPEIKILNIWTYFWSMFIISVVNWVAGEFVKK